jgi:hypothetical protein
VYQMSLPSIRKLNSYSRQTAFCFFIRSLALLLLSLPGQSPEMDKIVYPW